MKLSDLFDCTFVINLPERVDRRRDLTLELERVGLEFKPGTVELFAAIRPTDKAGFPSAAVRGCFLSHLGVLQEAKRRQLNSVLIMEDDLTISPLLSQSMEAVETAVEGDSWDLMYLGHIEAVTDKPPQRFVPFSGPLVTAHFYAVREPALSRLISYFEEVQLRPPGHIEGGPMYPDGAITMFRKSNPEIRTLIAQPNLGWQRPSRSDLHASPLERIPGVRYAFQTGRMVRAAFRRTGR